MGKETVNWVNNFGTTYATRVQVVNSDGEVIKGLVTDFIDEMDNDEQDEITILMLI